MVLFLSANEQPYEMLGVIMLPYPQYLPLTTLD